MISQRVSVLGVFMRLQEKIRGISAAIQLTFPLLFFDWLYNQVNFKKPETNESFGSPPSFSPCHPRFPEAQFHVRIIDCMRSSFKSRELRLIQGADRMTGIKGKGEQKIEQTSSNTFYKTRPTNFIYLELGFSISLESISAMPNMNIDYSDRY